MKIGIIGCGVVGSACAFGFRKLGHEVKEHDIKFGTTINDIIDTDIVYICVPTPMNEDGSCDTSIVESVIDELLQLTGPNLEPKYKGYIAIKSTITPGTTEKIKEKYKFIDFGQIGFVPEFLRERCAITDFVELNKLLVIGSTNSYFQYAVRESHGDYPQNTICCTATEAELIKYCHNTFNALRVTFANEFRQICDQQGADYNKIKRAIVKSTGVPDQYLDSNDNLAGWSSICWNKDIPALYSLINTLGLDLPLLKSIMKSNDKLKKTPFAGTRENY